MTNPNPWNTGRDLTGHTFGRLVALSPNGTIDGNRIWLCRCDCGNERQVRATNLITGHTRSCGCTRPNKKPAEAG